jgi:hypothetical protein
MSIFRAWYHLAKSEQALLRGRINWEAYDEDEADKIQYSDVLMRIDDDVKMKKKKLPYHNTRGGRSTTGGHDSQVGSQRIGSGSRIGSTNQIGSTRGSSQW